MLFNTLKYNASEPFVARTAGRAAVGTINALIVGLITAHMRLARFGTAVQEPTLDTRNDEVEGAVQAHEAGESVREEQGHTVTREDPLKLASRLKLIRDVVAANLEANAGERVLEMVSKTIKDPFHVAQHFEDTLAFMTNSVQAVSPTLVKEEAKALGISEEDVQKALAARPMKQQQFLHQNRAEILEIYKGLVPCDVDGYLIKPAECEAVLETLPAMNRLQIAGSADRALHRAYLREIAEYVRTSNPISKSNVGVLLGIRRQIFNELVPSWFEEPSFERDVRAAMERGSRYPEFGPKPAPVQPMEAERIRQAA